MVHVSYTLPVVYNPSFVLTTLLFSHTCFAGFLLVSGRHAIVLINMYSFQIGTLKANKTKIRKKRKMRTVPGGSSGGNCVVSKVFEWEKRRKMRGNEP